MKRREFIAFLGGAAVAWPLAARAQQATKIVRIGVLASSAFLPIQRLSRKLREHGYIEGQNLRFESRFAEGRDDRYPALAAELTAVPVDVIVTWGTPAAIAAKQATSTIPIVMGAIGDPVDVGIVSNLARPGGNITGFATWLRLSRLSDWSCSKSSFRNSPVLVSWATSRIRTRKPHWGTCAARRSSCAWPWSWSRSGAAIRSRAPCFGWNRRAPMGS
jgi:hypothetical protein